MIGAYIADHGGGWFVVVLGFALMLGGPIAVIGLFVHLVSRPSAGPQHGILFGIAVATWASLSELLVPYCGLYPSLPVLLIANELVPRDAGWQREVLINVVKFILWPAFGWCLFFLLSRMRRS